MESNNLTIINQFFEAYGKRDFMQIKQAIHENARWIFPGRNPLSGTKAGIEEIVAFFDKMGEVMKNANITVEKLIVAENEDYVVECQHIRTNREKGMNLDHQWCILWKFENGKIIEGKHFAENQHHADAFFIEYLTQKNF